MKIKENEKRSKYCDLAGEMNMLWNQWVKVISIVVGILGKVLRSLEKELEE